VDYIGRLTAHLPPAIRLLMVKADNSVLVHADGGSYKPLNWMSPPCWLVEEPGRWVVENKAGEQLLITIDEVLHDSRHDLGVDPGLVKDGVEAHLQVLLAEHVATLGEGWSLVRREYPTPIGPVDLMCRDAGGGSVAVEIKRRGEIDGVEQLTRYLELLNRAGNRHLRGPADQAAGPHAGPGPGHQVCGAGLRRTARARFARLPAVLIGAPARCGRVLVVLFAHGAPAVGGPPAGLH